VKDVMHHHNCHFTQYSMMNRKPVELAECRGCVSINSDSFLSKSAASSVVDSSPAPVYGLGEITGPSLRAADLSILWRSPRPTTTRPIRSVFYTKSPCLSVPQSPFTLTSFPSVSSRRCIYSRHRVASAAR